MRRSLLLLALAAAVASAPAARAAESAQPAKALYDQKCGACHGEVGMGTGLLARRMAPAVAPLEKRDNLTAPYVIRAARIGLGNMPAITRGDVSDAEMARIADYLAKVKP